MGCGASVAKWVIDEEAAWASQQDSVFYRVRCSWPSALQALAASFTVTLTGFSGVFLTIRGNATEKTAAGDPKSFAVEFTSAPGHGTIRYDAKTRTLRRGENVLATCKVLETHVAWNRCPPGMRRRRCPPGMTRRH